MLHILYHATAVDSAARSANNQICELIRSSPACYCRSPSRAAGWPNQAREPSESDALGKVAE